MAEAVVPCRRCGTPRRKHLPCYECRLTAKRRQRDAALTEMAAARFQERVRGIGGRATGPTSVAGGVTRCRETRRLRVFGSAHSASGG